MLNLALDQTPRPRAEIPAEDLSSRLGMAQLSPSDPCALAPTVPRSSAWFLLFSGGFLQSSVGRALAWAHLVEPESPKEGASCSLGLGPLRTEPLATHHLFARVLSSGRRRLLGASITETLAPVLSLVHGCLMLGPRARWPVLRSAVQGTLDRSGRFAFPLGVAWKQVPRLPGQAPHPPGPRAARDKELRLHRRSAPRADLPPGPSPGPRRPSAPPG